MNLHDHAGTAAGLQLFAQNRELFCIWEAARGEKPAPLREKLGPRVLQPFLAQLFILERAAEAQAYACRLAGTGIRALWGADMTGRDLREPAGAFEREVLARLFDTCFGMQQPFLARLRLLPSRGEPLVAEMLGLPVLDGAGEVQLLGAVQTLGAAVRKSQPLKAIQLIATRILHTEHSRKVVPFPGAQRKMPKCGSESEELIPTR